nr:PREDICTED: sarcolemmal membrane-associated protein isoform X1 [Bemisia tabaci]
MVINGDYAQLCQNNNQSNIINNNNTIINNPASPTITTTNNNSMNGIDPQNNSGEAGVAVLICRPNSHSFQDRKLSLDQVVKIGRSLKPRTKPAVNNGIFDCKVLSRNHALLSYSHGKFFIRDTKSSNGTFVNNHRLSKSGEESPWQEVCSGDIVQFGVDVQENSKNSKITHGSIIADLKLYLPDGTEASRRSSTNLSSYLEGVSLRDVYLLYEQIQDSLVREVALEQKLIDLQKLLSTIRESVDENWKVRISEDRLLSKIEVLENQLQIYSKNFPEDKLRDECKKAQESKNKCEENSKLLVEKILREKLDTETKCENLERTLSKTESDCRNWEVMLTKCREELAELARAHTSEIEDLQSQITNWEMERDFLNSDLEKKKESLQTTHLKLENALFELLDMRIKYEPESADKYLSVLDYEPNIPNLFGSNKNGNENENDNENESKSMIFNSEAEEKNDKESSLNILSTILKDRIKLTTEELQESRNTLQQLNSVVDELNSEKMAKLQHVNELQSELDSEIQNASSYEVVKKSLEQKMEETKKAMNTIQESPKSEEIINELIVNESDSESKKKESDDLENELKNSKDLLENVYYKIFAADSEIKAKKKELELAREAGYKASYELLALKQTVANATRKVKQQEQLLALLNSRLEFLNSDLPLVKKSPLESGAFNEVQGLQKALTDAQQTLKQSWNENKLLKDNISRLEADIETYQKNQNELSNALSVSEMNCESLSNCVNTMEQKLLQRASEPEEKLVKDNLATEKVDRVTETEFIEVPPPARIVTNLETSATDLNVSDSFKSKLLELESELVMMREKFRASNESKIHLETELSNLQQNYNALVDQPFYATIFMLPLIILFITFICNWYPKLSRILGTADAPGMNDDFKDNSDL